MRRRGIGLLHCHSSKAGLLGRVAGRIGGVPVLYTPHCFGFVGEVGASRKVFVGWAERALAPLASRIICVSEWERRTARAKGLPDRRLSVIHNGIEPVPETEAPAARELIQFRGNGLLVGSVAALRRQKRLDVLIDAAPAILDRVPSARIAIVGSGPEDAALRTHADVRGLLHSDRFAFFPFAPPSEQWVRALDVFVLPSSWESLPISLIEALACGVPQIATDVGGSSEVVDCSTGRLIPPAEPDLLADTVVEMLEHPDVRESLGRKSRERQEAEFSAARMVLGTVRLYDEALNGGGRP
jgi:glycosyltransferase involved in cell wall biosynthesis